MKTRTAFSCAAALCATLRWSDAYAQPNLSNTQTVSLYLSPLFLLALGLFAFFAIGLFLYWRRATTLARENVSLKTQLDTQASAAQQLTEQLQAVARDMQALAEMGQRIAAARNLQTLVGIVYERLNALMDADAFGIGAYDAEKQEIIYRVFVDMGVQLPEHKISMMDDDRPAVWCIAHKQDVLIGDFEKEYAAYIKRLPEPRAAGQPKSLMFSPLMTDSQAIGVVTAQSYRAHAYSPYHLNMLKILASYIALALESIEARAALSRSTQ